MRSIFLHILFISIVYVFPPLLYFLSLFSHISLKLKVNILQIPATTPFAASSLSICISLLCLEVFELTSDEEEELVFGVSNPSKSIDSSDLLTASPGVSLSFSSRHGCLIGGVSSSASCVVLCFLAPDLGFLLNRVFLLGGCSLSSSAAASC